MLNNRQRRHSGNKQARTSASNNRSGLPRTGMQSKSSSSMSSLMGILMYTLLGVLVIAAAFSLSSSTSSGSSKKRSSGRNLAEMIPPRPKWWYDLVEDVSRAFIKNPWGGDRTAWCIPEDPEFTERKIWEDIVPTEGFLYVKSHKTGSSTGSGITLRVAANTAKRDLKSDWPCMNWWNHIPAKEGTFANRTRSKSILWTIVRDPMQRALSAFFHFQAGRLGREPTDDAVIEYIHSKSKSIQFNYLMKDDVPKKELISSLGNPKKFIKDQVMDFYDFIALTERMDESLVVMRMLFEFDAGDMIVLSSKISGGFDDGSDLNKCIKIPTKFTTPGVEEYLAYNFTLDNLDFLLYKAAERSLEKTIDALGREAFEKELILHKRLGALAEKHCMKKAIFPCAADGTLQRHLSNSSCYRWDFGCGYACVDEVMEQWKAGKLTLPEKY